MAIIINVTINKERIIKAARDEKKVTHKETPIRLRVVFSEKKKILQARRECHDTFKVLKNKNCHPRVPYLFKLTFRYEKQEFPR